MNILEACYVAGSVFLIGMVISFVVAAMIKSIFTVIKFRNNSSAKQKGWKHSPLATNMPQAK
ncbi:hypothetical protein [Desulfotruncus alcoholivorax]|uniref:hypothetical protein n=1 Tax=Desulfotruncus alcoholivorax TaxID=265477 RepID=UPI00041ECE99|nr:hypothetical protein [Desulfotruncus alcoholivorax]